MASQISKTLSNKINKLQPFTDFYFSSQKSFKLGMMPNWIETYGRSLNNELTGRQKFYPVFNQGTIIMINFGVNIGEELSGPHFGIVINAKDSKHVGKITVLPLTSKFHKGHVRLGKNIVEETLRLISEKKKELDLAFQHMDNVLNESDILLTKFIAEYEVKSNEFSLDSLKVIQQAFQKAEKSVNFLPNRDIPLNQKIEFLRIFLLNVQPGSKDKQDLYALYTEMLVVVEKIEESKESLDLLEYKKHGLEHLYNQLQKYNNESFADIKNMTTISKTRVKKLSEYDISGNVSISNESLQKIKNSIHSFLNI